MRLTPVLRAWQHEYPRLYQVATALLIGVLLQVVLAVFEPPTLRVMRVAADDAADRMIRLAERTRASKRDMPVFALIDVDDATYMEWGARPVTPRDKLKIVLERVAKSKPLAILLDVDLSYSDASNPGGEAALGKFFEDYPASAPPLLLVRSLYHGAAPPALPFARPASYDRSTDKPNVLWGSPLFERDTDGKIRRWRLLAQACSDGRPVVLPALHLAAAMIMRAGLAGQSAIDAVNEVPKRLASFGADTCARPSDRSGLVLAQQDGYPAIRIGGADVSNRVLYHTAWQSNAVSLGQAAGSEGRTVPLVAIRPANLLLRGDQGDPVPGIENKLVVIGGSFGDSGDWHDTPIGRMPGVMLLINAIDALAVSGSPREPSPLEMATISTLILLITAICVAFFRPVVAALLTAGVIFAVMLLSLPVFRSGVVLNLAIPAAGTAAYGFFEETSERFRQMRKLGWRFIFKESPNTRKSASENSAGVADKRDVEVT